jgi:hypothetical protein
VKHLLTSVRQTGNKLDAVQKRGSRRSLPPRPFAIDLFSVDLLEPDFGPGITSGLSVMQQVSVRQDARHYELGRMTYGVKIQFKEDGLPAFRELPRTYSGFPV